jgi:hypothetical protein
MVTFVRRRAKHPVKPSAQKYPTLPKFGFVVGIGHPGSPRGAIVRRHWSRTGLRWTRQRQAREAWAGRVVPVSPRPRADERRWWFVSPTCRRLRARRRRTLWRIRRIRVRQNRVVLAVVATVKPSRRRKPAQPGGPASSIRGAREARGNSAPGRARHKPSSHCAGKAGRFRLHLYTAVQFYCAICAQRTAGASRHPVFPAPS